MVFIHSYKLTGIHFIIFGSGLSDYDSENFLITKVNPSLKIKLSLGDGFAVLIKIEGEKY